MAHIGDLVPKAGIYTEPGVVSKRNEDGTVLVDTEPMEVSKYHRYANTTGLTEQEKDTFNNILDQIYTQKNDVDKINGIQQQIDRLKTDPGNRNVVQYLRNQQAYLIRQAKQLPRVYNWDEGAIRG
jgi:hypothetical protein